MTEYRVRTGGLMRCCLATLDEAMAARAEPPAAGETLLCKYCKEQNGGMIFRDGAWEWNRPEDETTEEWFKNVKLRLPGDKNG